MVLAFTMRVPIRGHALISDLAMKIPGIPIEWIAKISNQDI